MPNEAAEPLIGVINAGSSSLKFSFYEGERRLLSGQVDGIGVRPAAQAVGADGKALAPPDFAGRLPASPSEVLPAMLPWARWCMAAQSIRNPPRLPRDCSTNWKLWCRWRHCTSRTIWRRSAWR